MGNKTGEGSFDRMMSGRSLIRGLFRCMIAAVVVIGTLGSTSVANTDHEHGDGSVIVHVSKQHDCCDAEHERVNDACRLACAQSPCGQIGLPAPGPASAFAGSSTPWWWSATACPTGITVETGTPPPRA